MGINNIKHRTHGGLGHLGIPLLILALFTWGLPRKAQAHHHSGYGYRFGGQGHGYAPTPLAEAGEVARRAGLGALDLKNVTPKKTAVSLNRLSPTDHQGWDELKELLSGPDPARAVGGEASGRHQTVNVWMVAERLAPGVQQLRRRCGRPAGAGSPPPPTTSRLRPGTTGGRRPSDSPRPADAVVPRW